MEPQSDDFRSWPPGADTVLCPYPHFSKLREMAPVYAYPQTAADGARTFIVTGWKEASQVLMNPRVFSNGFPPMQREVDLEPWPLPDVPRLYERPNVFFADGRDHSIKRSWALQFLTPQKIRAHRPLIEQESAALIASFARAGRCDFMAQYTDELCMRVIRKLMGLPEAADRMIKRVSAAIPIIDNNPAATREQLQEVADASLELMKLCAWEVLDRHQQPKGDFISEITQAQFAVDGQLDPNTIAKHVMVTVFGADHAMGAHLAQLVAHLAKDNELQRRVRDDRSLIWPTALETLRTENAVPWLFRFAQERSAVGGVEIPAGSTVLVATAAANYDPAEFPEPEDFRIDRTNVARNHLSMGRGIHSCVGTPMARLQAEVTVNTMFDLLDDIALDEQRSDLRPIYSLGFRVPRAVHLTFRAANQAGR